ncbi:hypothetical protein NON00_04685 [Roseomonas sp. GC11]|uniref:hypothetical protein n=1 Tax=Roseomonas sp. GC11 TaxID=2950546 RepID=UPI00210DF1F3|nr:hypothetical protein [Roseomonas sp. GC11]MCQ4159218.1 hypothetical protein [Roseomonas sp. GC11]
MNSTLIDLRAPELPLTEAAFCGWCGLALPGDRLVYHRGFLAVEISPLSFLRPEPERRELLRVAQRALKLAEAGLLHLVQQRHDEEDFSYLAIARPRSRVARGRLAEVLTPTDFDARR